MSRTVQFVYTCMHTNAHAHSIHVILARAGGSVSGDGDSIGSVSGGSGDSETKGVCMHVCVYVRADVGMYGYVCQYGYVCVQVCVYGYIGCVASYIMLAFIPHSLGHF